MSSARQRCVLSPPCSDNYPYFYFNCPVVCVHLTSAKSSEIPFSSELSVVLCTLSSSLVPVAVDLPVRLPLADARDRKYRHFITLRVHGKCNVATRSASASDRQRTDFSRYRQGARAMRKCHLVFGIGRLTRRIQWRRRRVTGSSSVLQLWRRHRRHARVGRGAAGGLVAARYMHRKFFRRWTVLQCY